MSKGLFRAYTSPLHPPVREWEPRNQMVAPGDLNPYLKDKKINKELYPVINVSDSSVAKELPIYNTHTLYILAKRYSQSKIHGSILSSEL